MFRSLAALLAVMLVVAACSSAQLDSAGTPAGDTSAGTEEPAGSDAVDEEVAPAPLGGGGGANTATVTLENGEVFSFGILCGLEPQESAGSEILFTVVSYDDPLNLDVTQFGADSFGGMATITLMDSSTYDTVWEAGGFGGGEVDLTLDGNTVRGSGVFVGGGDPAGPGVRGELVANC